MSAHLPTADGIVPDYGPGLSLVPLDGSIARIAHHGARAGAADDAAIDAGIGAESEDR